MRVYFGNPANEVAGIDVPPPWQVWVRAQGP